MSDFSLVKIPDERIAGCTDKLQMGVFSSGADVTKNGFNAISASNSAISFNIPVGSQSLILDRHITMEATAYWQLTIGGIAQNANALNIGVNTALQAFPLNSLFLTCSSQINNSNTSIQSQNIAPLILRMTDQYNLSKQNGGTPNYIDKYFLDYTDASGATTNMLGSYLAGGLGTEYIWGRGAFPINILSIQRWAQTDATHTSGTWPNGASTDNSLASGGVCDRWVIKLSATFREPLIGLSPWLSEESPKNSAGIYGLSTLQFNMTIDQSMKRFWSTGYAAQVAGNGSVATQYGLYTIAPGNSVSGTGNGSQIVNGLFGQGTSGVKMHMTFLSPQPSDAISLPMKNIVPYQNYNQTITSAPVCGTLSAGQCTTNTITLSVVPDLVMVCARKPMNNMTIADSNSFFTIQSVVIQFSNKSGIFSTLGSYDLYEISKRNGLQELSYIEWNGKAAQGTGAVPTQYYPTTGSLLVMNPVDWSLPDWIAPGSAGQYSFSIIVNYFNNSAVDSACEVAVTCIESGLMITESGQSALQIGVLSKDDVLDAKESKVIVPRDNREEQSGGSFSAKIRTAMKHFDKYVHHNHHHKQHEEHEESGGAFSAGKRHGKLSKYIR